MRRFLTGPAALSAVVALLPLPAYAGNNNAQPPAEEDEGELVLDEDEMEAAAPTPEPGAESGPVDDSSFLEDDDEQKADAAAGVGGAGGEAAGIEVLTPEEQQKIDEQMITVVQRQAFLNVYKDPDSGKTVRRFGLQPQIGLSVNDPFVRHYMVGAEFNFWLTNRMALGITGSGFFGAKTPAYDRIRFQDGLLLTANRYLWQASLNYLYEPFYGKISVFNRFLMHWEAYIQLGGGILHSRVIPRYEAIHEPFDNFNPQGNFAIGSRFYASSLDFVSFNIGVRTWIFPDTYEPQNRGPNDEAGPMGEQIDDPSLDDPANAKAAGVTKLAFNTVLFLGVSFYLPPRFSYSTRR
jgi:outer membrane beta-barrel protein